MPTMKKRTPTRKRIVKPKPTPPVRVPPGTEAGLTRNQIIQELTRSAHGKLSEYVPVGLAAARDAEFYAHLIAWNEKTGQLRDSKVALPVLSLASKEYPADLVQNSLAHIAMLDPRMLERAIRFAKAIEIPGRMGQIWRVVEAYLRAREKNWAWWERAALQHRETMKTLYSLGHVKPNAMAQMILFDRNYPHGTVFYELSKLGERTPLEIAGKIMKHRIPFLVAHGALGSKMKEVDVVLALLGAMSPTEVVTNTAFLERLGIKTNPALRAGYEAALVKVADSKKATFKTTAAADAQTDEKLEVKLRAVQEKQLRALAIEGNWLILGDCSSSMDSAIESAKLIAATLAKLVKGQVHLVFFNTSPTYYPVTGLDYDQVREKTKHVQAYGGTSIGCGLMSIMERGVEVDGIVVVSDAQENTPPQFSRVYDQYVKKLGKPLPVYLYRMKIGRVGYSDVDMAMSMKAAGHDLQEFDLRHGVDYHSLPGLATTMRANRYSLVDEIMSVPLLTLEQALTKRA